MPRKKYRSIKKPSEYEAIKQKLIQKGVPEDEAQTRAARISNADAKKERRKKKRP